jgi:predicted TIM-barrel enzyme
VRYLLRLTRNLSPCYAFAVAEAKAMPDDAYGVNGFYGAYSKERLYAEIAIREQVEKFKAIRY